MGKIHVMDDHLANKIAAGEVVERPASVVKELVENAIDADATRIEVFLEEAGLQKIQVIDNGYGMDEEDAIRSFERHATSKISTEHDLFRIRTLGFRGEALASIASVSKIELTTSTGLQDGLHLQLEGGDIREKRGAAKRQGTDLSVQQLFFNTPARLKYMKTIQTELGHCMDVLNRLALSYPTIAFKVFHYDDVLLNTNGRGQIVDVIAAIYGIQVAKQMIPIHAQSADFEISGFISKPEITRASKNYMSLFVNNRWVKQYALQQSIIQGYHTFLPIGRFPIVTLYITGDPYLTDVNVHPAKQHIRLSKEKELQQLVEEAVRTSLRKTMRAPEVTIPKQKMKSKDESTQLNMWEQPTRSFTPIVKETIEDMLPVQTFDSPVTTNDEKAEMEEKDEDSVIETPSFPQLDVVGQIHGTYIAAQSENGFYLIDQHAAQERIKYEFYRDRLAKPDQTEFQPLIVPLTFHYSKDEMLRIEESMEQFEQVGIQLESFGDKTYIVREHPTWFPKGEEVEIIQQMIEQVLTKRKIDILTLREEAAILMSCKRSIKANHFLTRVDMEKLLHDLGECQQPYTCPHGRPILIHFSTYELEKMFKRVM